MPKNDEIEQNIYAALEREPRVNMHESPISIRRLEGGTVLLMGDVTTIEAKRVAADCVERVHGVDRVIDRLRLRQTQRPGDGALRDTIFRRLSLEPVYLRATIRCRIDGDADVIANAPDGAEDEIDASVSDGVVTLHGRVQSLSHKRLAAVLAWWAVGCRDVVNELEISPPEEDNDDEVSDAIRIVLEKDHLVHGDQITVQVRDRCATLRGVVANENEKWLVSRDVWYVEGVRDVVNELRVSQPLGRKP